MIKVESGKLLCELININGKESSVIGYEWVPEDHALRMLTVYGRVVLLLYRTWNHISGDGIGMVVGKATDEIVR